jgi:capsule biosynthesis phosphatase
MRICIDLDGVIAELKKENETYADVKPISGVVEKIRKLKENGHYIIIYTARHMKTCDGNVSKVLAKIGKITLDWLEKYQIPYDEIVFGKPWADIYIDDNGFRFKNWNEINEDGSNLPISNEKKLRGDE